MVDFDNEATVGTPAVDIVRVLILQRRNDALDALEFYKKKTLSGVEFGTELVSSRLLGLYLEIEPLLGRKLEPKEQEELMRKVDSQDYEELLVAFQTMNKVLDGIRLTRIDTGKQIDTTNIEEENRAKGL